MLFKEKLLLSNCDSVRQLNSDEVSKRFLTGLAFGDGVVMTPNMLIDNPDTYTLLKRPNVIRYLNEEGHGKLVIRGFGLHSELSLQDYFDSLPDNYIISSLPGSPCKAELHFGQKHLLRSRIQHTEKALRQLGYRVEPLTLASDSLQKEVLRRIQDEEVLGYFFADAAQLQVFSEQAELCISRSQWYQFVDAYFGEEQMQPGLAQAFKCEVINPAYNSLFALQGEGFLQDEIKYLHQVPQVLLDSSITFKAFRKEIRYIKYPLKAFEIISNLGAGEIIKVFTDEALNYIEDKLVESGQEYFSRKNWFGLYHKLREKIGLELK